MQKEYSISDIFTEFDDSIFRDGSIDPMGLRIIWTSLGNKIFHKKLNTVSTDIRYYTINLFHHHLVQQITAEDKELVFNLVGKPPYNNKVDLHQGLIIWLESLLIHACNYLIDDEDSRHVPGIFKLQQMKDGNPNHPDVVYLRVLKSAGILSRQNLLGIHGRHKGPFQQMGIFIGDDYYYNISFWENEVRPLFSQGNWQSLASAIRSILIEKVLLPKKISPAGLRIKATDVVNDLLVDQYRKSLDPSNFQQSKLVHFWESRLGLDKGDANLLYQQCINQPGSDSYESLIVAARSSKTHSGCLDAICAVEPLLTCIGKLSSLLLKRGRETIYEDDLIAQTSKWLQSSLIIESKIQPYLTGDFFEQQALKRLKLLFDIYANCRREKNPELFLQRLVSYHKEIMNERGNMPWVTSSQSGKLTQHRSISFTSGYQQFLENEEWVNDYYLSTVQSLRKGLYAA